MRNYISRKGFHRTAAAAAAAKVVYPKVGRGGGLVVVVGRPAGVAEAATATPVAPVRPFSRVVFLEIWALDFHGRRGDFFNRSVTGNSRL